MSPDPSSRPRLLRRILLVDDERDIRAIARIALESVGGFEVEECASGAEALARMDALQPDLVLLDAMMPEMDGVETLRALRERLGPAAPPTIFLTARVQAPESDDYGASGALGVITKPFDPMKLAKQVMALWTATLPARAVPEMEVEISAVTARFVATLPAVAAELEAAVSSGSPAAVRAIVHRIRGTAGTLALGALAGAAAELGDALRAGAPLASLEPQVERFRALLADPS